MRSRITYDFKPEPSIGKSRQRFRINGKDLMIILNMNTMTFTVEDVDGIVYADGGSKNRNVLLRKAKRAIEKLGHAFKEETNRNRDYGLVKKEDVDS